MCVRVLVPVVGDVGTIEKVFFVCLILVTELLIVILHDIVESGVVRVLIDNYRYHVSEDVWAKINI
jgi:hypothetical protein